MDALPGDVLLEIASHTALPIELLHLSLTASLFALQLQSRA
jgi:hypothetical protein